MCFCFVAEKHVEALTLYTSHCDSWADVWRQGRIDCWGSLPLSRTIYGCLYYLYSSLMLRESDDQTVPFYGLSPESLAYGDKSHDVSLIGL